MILFFFDKPLIAIPSVSFEFRINRVRSNDALCFLRPILLRYDVTITLLCPFSFFFSFFLSISTHVFYILSSKFYLPFEQGSLSNRRQSSSSKNNRCYEISETEREKKTMQQCILRALQKLRRDAYIRRSFAILSGPTQIFLGRMRKIKADFTLFKLFPPSLNHTSPQSSLRIPPTVLRIPLYTYIYIYIVSSTLIEIYSSLHRQAPEITPR